MITEDYCSYEVAKLLKEKGFDEPCLKMWEYGPTERYLFRLQSSCYQNITEEDSCLAPTHQMAMKWLREIYDIFIDIGYDDLDWYWLIESISIDIPYADRPKLIKNGTACHKTYEEAVEAALKYTLENLI